MRGRGDTQRELADRARTMIAIHAGGRLRADEIASRLGCSVYHLSRTFHRVHGRTLTAYRAEVRLHRAMARLRREPGADLTDVALACGYSSHSHFTASFRKRLGTTPSAFAASVVNAPARTQASPVPYGRYNR